MAVRGERFSIDLSSTDGARDADPLGQNGSGLSEFTSGFLGDIQERTTSNSPTAPLPPRPKSFVTGFPAHRNRERLSAFIKQRTQTTKDPSSQPRASSDLKSNVSPTASAPLSNHDGHVEGNQHGETYNEVERSQIDKENRERLAGMSSEEIKHERQELFNGLSPSLIEKLLKRANINDGREDPDTRAEPDMMGAKESTRPRKAVSFDVPQPVLSNEDQDTAPLAPPAGLRRAASWGQDVLDSSAIPPSATVHFPRHPDPPDLDPDDPSFLSNLHEKYFPTLSADPSKLAWMAPIPNLQSVADNESPYSPSQESLPASAIRFGFRGDLLPPRRAREIPVTKGLHHHGEAPEAAGYTLPELARLSRSTFSAQRCVAYQTLGRILYRLGKGGYGDEGSELSMGLWRCIEEGKIFETLQEEASREGGHISAQAYATEAVWNWQKGGGRRWKAG